MARKRVYWILATTILVAVAALLFIQSGPTLVSGKPVSYWLNTSAGWDGLLPPNNPLVGAGPEIPTLLSAVKSPYPERDLVNRLLEMLPFLRPHFLPHLPDWQIRQAAAFRLGLFGPAASNAVPTLMELLTNPPAEFPDKWRIIQALGFIGPAAKAAVPVLVDNLSDQEAGNRKFAVHSLLQIETVPPEAVPALKRNPADA